MINYQPNIIGKGNTLVRMHQTVKLWVNHCSLQNPMIFASWIGKELGCRRPNLAPKRGQHVFIPKPKKGKKWRPKKKSMVGNLKPLEFVNASFNQRYFGVSYFWAIPHGPCPKSMETWPLPSRCQASAKHAHKIEAEMKEAILAITMEKEQQPRR